MGKTHTIKNHLGDLAIKAIKTLPLIPEQISYMYFLANGIPRGNERECREAGIMPDTILKFRYDTDLSLYTTREPISDRKDCFEDLTKGGRIHQILFETSLYGEDNFKDFIQKVERLREEGYELHRGTLAITTYHLTGYNQGDYPDTKLRFGKKNLELKEGREISNEDLEKLVTWFNSLKKPTH